MFPLSLSLPLSLDAPLKSQPQSQSQSQSLTSSQEKKRSFFVVVGDRGKDVILNLHYILGSADPKQNKSVLWAYKHKLLGFTRCAKLPYITLIVYPQQSTDLLFLLLFFLLQTATAKSAKPRSRRKSSAASVKPIPRTRSSSSSPSQTSAMSTTKRPRRSWGTRTGCVSCKTSRR